MPPAEFPLPGNYSIDRDQQAFAGPFSANGWDRLWSSTGVPQTLDYWYVEVRVFVYPDHFAREAIASETCNFNYTNTVSKGEVTAQVIGDGAKACRYVFPGNISNWNWYITGTRNVEVMVGAAPRSGRLTDADALNACIAVARQQLAIINRVSPP